MEEQMASFSASHNVTSQAREWYGIRDLLLGENLVKRDILCALVLAAACEHPDACWLSTVCAGKGVKTREAAFDVFLSLGENDARALCFAWCVQPTDDWSRLSRSAELGYAFAQAMMVLKAPVVERFRVAQLAALQGERFEFLCLGYCMWFGYGCEKDLEKAKENYLLAAVLGDVNAMEKFGDLLDDFDPMKWHWLGRAALGGCSEPFLRKFPSQMQKFNSGSGSVMFAIGRALNGHMKVKAKQIFGSGRDFDSLIRPANQAVAFFNCQLLAYRKAVDAWTGCGMRLGVVKDIRLVIGRLIWEAREAKNLIVLN
jgi:hypothetical protein